MGFEPDELFKQELDLENDLNNTFSMIKLNICLNDKSETVNLALTKLLNADYLTTGAERKAMFAILHECTHYWHWIGTTLGFHSSRLTMAQSFYIQYILYFLNKYGVETFPIPLIKLDVQKVPRDIRENIQSAIKAWKHIELYKKALLGYSPVLSHGLDEFNNEIIPGALMALIEFDRAKKQFGSSGDTNYSAILDVKHGDRYNLEFVRAHKIHQLYQRSSGQNFAFSGLAIFESAAYMQEMMLHGEMTAAGCGMDQDFEKRVSIGDNSIYGAVINIALSVLPDSTKLVRLLPHLCDIAMMGAIDPLYTDPLTKSVSWLDIHPGFRFHKALLQVKKIGLPSENAPDEAFTELINKICENENWIRPYEIALHAGRFRPMFEEQHELYTSINKFVNLNPYSEIRKRHCEAMRLRESNPSVYAKTLHNFTDLYQNDGNNVNYFKPPIIIGSDFAYLDTRFLSFFIIHNILRKIAISTLGSVNESDIFPQPLRKIFDSTDESSASNLILSMIWEKIGFSKNRFVAGM